MFKLLKIQYQDWKKIDKSVVAHAVVRNKITAEQYREIVGEEYKQVD